MCLQLNALQVQIYGKDAIQDYRDVKENRSVKEIVKNISKIERKKDKCKKIQHKYMHLVRTYTKFHPVLINNLNRVSNREVTSSNSIEDNNELNKYSSLPKLNGEEEKVVKYFMLKHKVDIPGKGMKQGYSLSAVSIEGFKKVENKDIQKLLLEYLILRVALVEEIIHFRNEELQDKYRKVRNIIFRDGKYNSSRAMESYSIELLISLLIDNKYSKYANITLNKKIELLKQKLDEIIKESGKRKIVEYILNSLISSYHEKLSFNNDISNIVDSIMREEKEFSHNIASLSQWKRDFIDFLYELNYYYCGNKLSEDVKKVDIKVLNVNLVFLRFLNTKVRPILRKN